MSIIIRRICMWGVGVAIVAGACAADEGGGETQGDGSSSMGEGTPTTTMGGETSSSSTGIGEVGSTDPTAADDSSTDDGAGDESSSDDDGGSSGSESGGALAYDPEFVWVADFLRVNCSECHATDSNGNLVLPNPDIDNEQVRLALEDVVATTGLMLVEPGDHQASQTWLQITNEFGAQFMVEDTDRFAAWIDAGTPYYAQ